MVRFAKPAPYRSPLEGVSDALWGDFARAMSTQGIRSTSAGGGIGSFDLRPRRLGEIGVMDSVSRIEGKRWAGTLALKYASLPKDPTLQYEVFVMSVRGHDEDIRAGRVTLPDGVSRSGALAILHCGGRGALGTWPAGAFRTTRETFSRANGIF